MRSNAGLKFAASSPRRIVRRTASGSKISLRSQTAKAIEASTVLTEVPRWLLEVTSPVPLRALRASRTGVFDVPSSSAIDFSVSGLPALYRPERMALLISLAIRSPRDPKRGCTLASSRSWTIVSYTTHNILCSFGWLQRGLLMESREGPESPRLGPTLALPQVSAYLYPWDLVGDPLVVARLASAGFEHVSVAAAYHSVRAATPQHPQHRFVVAESAALYRPVRSAAWAGRRLSPFSAPWTGSEDSFERAVEALGAGGLRPVGRGTRRSPRKDDRGLYTVGGADPLDLLLRRLPARLESRRHGRRRHREDTAGGARSSPAPGRRRRCHARGGPRRTDGCTAPHLSTASCRRPLGRGARCGTEHRRVPADHPACPARPVGHRSLARAHADVGRSGRRCAGSRRGNVSAQRGRSSSSPALGPGRRQCGGLRQSSRADCARRFRRARGTSPACGRRRAPPVPFRSREPKTAGVLLPPGVLVVLTEPRSSNDGRV